MEEKGQVTFQDPSTVAGSICRSHSNPSEGKGRGMGAEDTIRMFALAGSLPQSSSGLTPYFTEGETEAWRNEGLA